MAFIKGTKIFTNEGWKQIEDISGNDKVLIRNFIGDAEFIQPFALKKRKYNGKITKIGARTWEITVTPDHKVVYERSGTVIVAKASEVEVHPKNRIYRSFKYMPPEDYKPEHVKIDNVFGRHRVTISNQDFFVLMGYALCRGKIEKHKNHKAAIQIALDSDKRDEEIKLLSDILYRIGVEWSLIPRENDKWLIRIGSKSSLATLLIARLGSKTRKKMFLPDKVIYNSSRQLAQTLIETIINASKKAETIINTEYQYVTSNEKLIDSLVLLGTLSGYGMSKKLVLKSGTDTGITVTKNNVYGLTIRKPVKTYSPTYIKNIDYDGYIYEIDIFDGQVYVKEDSAPVWVNPK